MVSTRPIQKCVIADDTRSPRELVANWLRACQFECHVAENGLQAWESICCDPPDLLITDLEMPVLCGLELLERVRQSDDKQIRELPVLVMTSLRDGHMLEVVKSLGGNALLHKPLAKKPTLSVVLNLIAGRHALGSEVDDHHDMPRSVVSPTLRRLLATVASQPFLSGDSGRESQ